MKRVVHTPLLFVALATLDSVAALSGCKDAELVTAKAINADRTAFMDEEVRLQGERVKDTSYLRCVTTGLLREFVMEGACESGILIFSAR